MMRFCETNYPPAMNSPFMNSRRLGDLKNRSQFSSCQQADLITKRAVNIEMTLQGRLLKIRNPHERPPFTALMKM